MKTCSACNKRIALGGEEFGTEIYCGERCKKMGLISASHQILTNEIVQNRIHEVHAGSCPKCGGEGPNDMQWHYTIWSFIVITSHKDIPEVCCRNCGLRKKIGGFFYSILLGWWGFPFGILLTPVQVIRNFIGFFILPKQGKVSRQLDDAIRMELGAEALLEKARIEFELDEMANSDSAPLNPTSSE